LWIRSKYSRRHPILKYPQPMFLPRCERPFTPIQNNTQNYNTVYLIFIFLDGKLKTKDSAPNNNRHSLRAFRCIIKLTKRKASGFSQMENILLYLNETIAYFVFNYIMTSACILTSRHDHVLSFMSIYF
jgi:hypothetical protein